MEEERILYFGYGLNRSPDFLEALLGRVPELHEADAVLNGYELLVQSLDELPEAAQQNIAESYGRDFVSYVICKSGGKYVRGSIWSITPSELRILNNWEFEGVWQKLVDVEITGKDGEKYKAKTHDVNVYAGRPAPENYRHDHDNNQRI